MKICVVIALTTAVMLMELIAYAAAFQPNYWADGCRGVTDFHFTQDCIKHDICYACGARFGVSRLDYDNRWNENMKSTCSRSRAFLRPGCRMIAAIYYRANRNHGNYAYRDPSVWFCDQDWVPACV